MRAEIISLHKSATAFENGGMSAIAEANRRTARMLARLQVEIDKAGVE